MAINTSMDIQGDTVSGNMDSLVFRDPTDTIMTPQKAVILSVLSTSNVFMLLGNGFSIYIILCSPSLRRHTYYWLVLNLAVLDLLNSSTVVPLNIVWEFYGAWPFSQLLCDVEISLDLGFSTVAAYSTVLLSMDKYLFITKPFFYYSYVGPKMTLASISAVWSVWMTYSTASVFGELARSTKQSKYDFHLDACNFVLTHGFAITSFILVFFIPLVILLFTSSRILWVARRHIMKIQEVHRISDAATTSLDLSVCVDIVHTSSSTPVGESDSSAHHCGRSSTKQSLVVDKKEVNMNIAAVSSNDLEKRSSPLKAAVTHADCKNSSRANKGSSNPPPTKRTPRTTSSTVRAFGTVTLVVFAYIIMFAPYWIGCMVNLVCVCIEPLVFEDYLAVFCYMHSLVNPYIYMATDRRYKSAIRCLLVKSKLYRRCKRASPSVHVSSVCNVVCDRC